MQGAKGVVVIAEDMVSNDGPMFSIPPSRSLVLGFGKVHGKVRGVVVDGELTTTSEDVISVSLVCDHRVVDGVSWESVIFSDELSVEVR